MAPRVGRPGGGILRRRADQLDAEAEARLSEVAAFLASVPAPALPDAVEARISAALAAEAAARQPTRAGPAPADGAADGSEGPAAARAARGRRQPGRRRGPRRGFRVRPAGGGRLARLSACCWPACGFALSRGSSSSQSASSRRPPRPRRDRAVAAAIKRGRVSAAAGVGAPRRPRRRPRPELRAGHAALVLRGYRERHQVPAATLAEQVRARLTARRRSRASRGLDPRGERQAASAGAVAPSRGAARVRAPPDRRRATPAGRPGHLPGEPGVRHRQFDSRVGGGTRLHGGQTGTHRVCAAGWLTRESPRPSIG